VNGYHVFPGPATVEALKNSTNTLEKIVSKAIFSSSIQFDLNII